tara:strand:- start:213 stop:335 length:123 start_codon:yes stop_codon:yes gene_type:complete
MSIFLINNLGFELDLMNSGMIKVNTATKKIAGTNCSNPIS